MLSHLKERRTRQHIVEVLKPLTGGSLHPSPTVRPSDWLKPFAVGFMGTLITSLALSRSPRMSQSALGQLQVSAWAELTGLDGCVFSDELCLLSASTDPSFHEGCARACQFVEHFGFCDYREPHVSDPESAVNADWASIRESLWRDLFELPLAQH